MRAKIVFWVFILTFPFNAFAGARTSPSLIYIGKDNGMFSIFISTIAGISSYEKRLISGFKVDFGSQGLYYDPNRGPNWWNYYCEPICLGIIDSSATIKVENMTNPAYVTVRQIEEYYSREEINRLINSYIKYKPHIRKKVNEWVNKNFIGHFVIGVHYRGTDKYLEVNPVPYQIMINTIQQKVEEHLQENLKIYVATDEAEFLDIMKTTFPGYVCCLEEAMRSTNGAPIHYTTTDPYKQGEEALLDALILSKTNLLIRTSSNLSLWSTYSNPQLPVIELSKRHL